MFVLRRDATYSWFRQNAVWNKYHLPPKTPTQTWHPPTTTTNFFCRMKEIILFQTYCFFVLGLPKCDFQRLLLARSANNTSQIFILAHYPIDVRLMDSIHHIVILATAFQCARNIPTRSIDCPGPASSVTSSVVGTGSPNSRNSQDQFSSASIGAHILTGKIFHNSHGTIMFC